MYFCLIIIYNMIKYTRTTLNKLLQILAESDYVTRFEKGNFVSGYALVKDKKIIVINKFFDTESRINTLLELMGFLDIEYQFLSLKSKRFYRELIKNGLILNKKTDKTEEE